MYNKYVTDRTASAPTKLLLCCLLQSCALKPKNLVLVDWTACQHIHSWYLVRYFICHWSGRTASIAQAMAWVLGGTVSGCSLSITAMNCSQSQACLFIKLFESLLILSLEPTKDRHDININKSININ